MQNTTSTILAMFMAAVLLFIVPLTTLTERNDNVTQEKVKLIVEEFVTEVRNTGKLTRTQFQNLENRLNSSGNNAYLIDIEIKYLDENPGKKTAQTHYDKIGENVYYSEYTTQILRKIGIKTTNESVSKDDDVIILKPGDFISVNVKNANSTAAQNLKKSVFSFSNAGEYVIEASSSGMITVNGTDNWILADIPEEEPEEPQYYTVTYNLMGGTDGPEMQTTVIGHDTTISTTVPKRDGYIFKGWAVNYQKESPPIYGYGTRIKFYIYIFK